MVDPVFLSREDVTLRGRIFVQSPDHSALNMISETTFVGKKDAPKILYKLWKDEYLHMEKFVVTGAKQSQFLSWKVNKPSLWKHVLDEMLHAALNLSQRVAYEWEKEIEFINPPVGNKEEGANRKVNVRFLLESSLLKLDDAIMLFHDF